MPRERDKHFRDDRPSGWHKDGEDDRHARKPKRSTSSMERGTNKKRNFTSDANSVMPNPWTAPPNSKSAVPMFLPGMMMPPQFPPYFMQMPFPAPDGEQVKAFQKAMMAAPFNTFPPKGMPSGMFLPQPKLAQILAKKRPKIAKESESEYPEHDPSNMYMVLKKEIFDGLQKELRSQEPHLVRLMSAPGLFDRSNMDSSSSTNLCKYMPFNRKFNNKAPVKSVR